MFSKLLSVKSRFCPARRTVKSFEIQSINVVIEFAVLNSGMLDG